MTVTFSNVFVSNLNSSIDIINTYVKGIVNNHIYSTNGNISNLKIDNSILLGGGGGSTRNNSINDGLPGCHAIINNTNYTITKLQNYGSLAGGGGGSGQSLMYSNPNISGTPGGGGQDLAIP